MVKEKHPNLGVLEHFKLSFLKILFNHGEGKASKFRRFKVFLHYTLPNQKSNYAVLDRYLARGVQ